MLNACAASPEKLCSSIVPEGWQYVGEDPRLSALLDASLPHAPYKTNEGRTVRTVRHIWYRSGDDSILGCTLDRHARDTCSIGTSEFVRTGNTWSKRGEDAVLCNVIGRPKANRRSGSE